MSIRLFTSHLEIELPDRVLLIDWLTIGLVAVAMVVAVIYVALHLYRNRRRK